VIRPAHLAPVDSPGGLRTAAIVMLSLAAVWMMLHAYQTAASKECLGQYRAARTPADIARVDRLIPHRGSHAAPRRPTRAGSSVDPLAGGCSTHDPWTARQSLILKASPVPIRVVRLGSPRFPDEGIRIGTVRRPPRGIPREQFRTANFYDVWLPMLAPSEALVKAARASATDAQWRRFQTRFRAEMKRPDPSRLLDLLAALSHSTNFSVGCYCEDEHHCHRLILRDLLAERHALIV
jgi:uncharacterized protein YeaO (DUF488 family)